MSEAQSNAISEPANEPMETALHDEIATLAYDLWTQRGCPIGSPEEDWFNAEEALNSHNMMTATAG